MAICTPKKKSIQVALGQIQVGREGDQMTTVLGSCVGVALYHPRRRVGALAHVVLADSAGPTTQPGKFADTAIPHMIKLLEKEGANRAGLVAKIAGGAKMFGGVGPMKIGTSNIEAVLAALDRAGIRVAGQEVGGAKGRRMEFDCSTGDATIATAQQQPVVL